jgi:hypothetical protein
MPYSARVMSDEPTQPSAHSSIVTPTAADLPLIAPVAKPSSIPVRFGGLFGIAGCVLGLIVLLVGCAGFGKAFMLAYACVAVGAFGLLLVVAGALLNSRRIGEDTHVLQAVFACLMSIIGGVLELAIWLKWPLFK